MKAASFEDLARQLGIDAAGLSQTVRDYNMSAERGTNDAFGRTLPEPFRAPFYGIRISVALYHTQGGLKVTSEGQVLRRDGSITASCAAFPLSLMLYPPVRAGEHTTLGRRRLAFLIRPTL